MLARGLDASFNPPNFTEAFAEGYRFIVRYLCPTPNRKVIDPDEVKRIHAAKLGLVLDWENDSGDSLRGRNGGLADGRQALALARDWIKYPKGSVIFFSVGDFDALPNQFPAIDAYLDGVREAFGGHYEIGAYGGAGLLRHLKANHKAAYFWQACASTGWFQNGSRMPDAHIYQTTLGVTKAGGTVDLDEQNLAVPMWLPAAPHASAKPAAPQAPAKPAAPQAPAKPAAPAASAPRTARVPASAGASNKAGLLNIYSYVQLGPTGTLIVELASHYPKAHEMYVTSGMDGDHGPRPNGSHHYGLSFNGSSTAAIDFGAYDKVSKAEGDRRMRDLARWFENVMPATVNIVELIHTTPFADDNGFYVKNCQRIASFGSDTDKAHLDHVHLAMSQAQVTAALARVKAAKPMP